MTHLTSEQRELLPLAFGEFLDTAATATSRATFYNTRAEQEAAVESVHRDLFEMDRGIYTAALMLPGLTDFSRQIGAVRLLRSAQRSDGLLSPEQEARRYARTAAGCCRRSGCSRCSGCCARNASTTLERDG